MKGIVMKTRTSLGLLAGLASLFAHPLSAERLGRQDTPDFVGLQTYKAAEWHDINRAAAIYGATGQGVTIADNEGTLDWGHSDLQGPNGPRIEILQYGETLGKRGPAMCLRSKHGFPCTSGHMQHGTMIAGIIMAQNNGFGVTGIVPDAKYLFASSNSIYGEEKDLDHGLIALDSRLKKGDVLLLQRQSFLSEGQTAWTIINTSEGDPNFPLVVGQGGPIDADETVRPFLKDFSSRGVTVVFAAGNSNAFLPSDKKYAALPDEGFLKVGATLAKSRLKYPYSNFGGDILLNSWGQGIATTGFSYSLTEETHSKIWPSDAVAKLDLDRHPKFGPVDWWREIGNEPDYYTDDFGGTSGASAIVAGMAAALQGVAKRELGRCLTPREIRSALQDSAASDNRNQGIGVTPRLFPAIQTLLGPTPSFPILDGTDTRFSGFDSKAESSPFWITVRTQEKPNGYDPEGSCDTRGEHLQQATIRLHFFNPTKDVLVAANVNQWVPQRQSGKIIGQPLESDVLISKDGEEWYSLDWNRISRTARLKDGTDDFTFNLSDAAVEIGVAPFGQVWLKFQRMGEHGRGQKSFLKSVHFRVK